MESKSKSPADSGPAYKLIVRVCGLLAVAALALPFAGKFSIRELISRFQAGTIGSMMEDLPAPPVGSAVWMNYLYLVAFLAFVVIGLYMLFTAKYAGGPLTFLILLNAGGFALTYFLGDSMGLTSGFYGMVGPGYYAACGALFAPFIAMFFLDKSI